MKGFLITLLIFWIISRLLKKNVYINTFNSYNNQQSPDTNSSSRKREGEMSIDKGTKVSSKKNKKNKNDDDDFVDYEEIK